MAKLTPFRLKEMAGKMFQDHAPVKSLWQTLADHFYAERADFTQTRNVGQELADTLLDSYPLLIRRDLGNSLSAMLRDGHWFNMGIMDGEPDHLGRMWLDWATGKQRQAMYDRDANFVKSTKQGDHDYVTFGQAVLTVKPNMKRNTLLYQCWHLRDVAWFDDETGSVGGVCRDWKPKYHEAYAIFGDRLHGNITRDVHRSPFKECAIKHFVLPAQMYDEQMAENPRLPYVSIYLDTTNEHIISELPVRRNEYVIPRFQTIAGSPYAYSPATVVALPDARCLQAMTHTLMEAAERYARPPIIATRKVVRSDVDFSPNGITWVDEKYDERLGASLRTIPQDRGGFPIGQDMRDGVVDVLASAFYLNKLSLPEVTRDMTAYEVSERMKQFRRENLPLFAPIEAEYNAAMCEKTFEVLTDMGRFGSPYDIPDSLQGNQVRFKFQSPLSEDEERERAQKFQQTATLLRDAAEFDPGVIHNLNFDEAFRDAVTGNGAPSRWLKPIEIVQAGRNDDKQQAMMAPIMEAVAGAA